MGTVVSRAQSWRALTGLVDHIGRQHAVITAARKVVDLRAELDAAIGDLGQALADFDDPEGGAA
jgi:hypothetical protein